jgi:RHH-type proline utilization regulon transcriptional repressor/proline dehydrogenase/delta 1-pyrroline-5-carboxylate dehydrogenase
MSPKTSSPPLPASDLEASVRRWGARIFDLLEKAEAPSLFSKKGFYGPLMEWTMKDERFKIQLFRFVDVLPSLGSSGEVARHLREYLDNDDVPLSPTLRTALKATSFAGGLLGAGLKSQVAGMARMFMLEDDPRAIVSALRERRQAGVAFTVDILGETEVSEPEADAHRDRCLELLSLLGRESDRWRVPCTSDAAPGAADPPLNVSIKISALYSQIHPADPETAVQRLSERLRPILRRAIETGAFINFDMESFAFKDLTIRLFESVFSEPEFASGPPCGLAIQAYLRDSEKDLRRLLTWAREHRQRIVIRLVKGAYWDYEQVIAAQKGWPVPVFTQKADTDANYERLSRLLLENDAVVGAAFGTHNVRAMAAALAQAESLGVPLRNFEFQMIFGMAEPIKLALVELGLRVREYTPVGDLLPGMAYLVRRLLENTSNEGFLANKFARGIGRDQLLRDPAESTTPAPGELNNPRDDAGDASRGNPKAVVERGWDCQERGSQGLQPTKAVSNADTVEEVEALGSHAAEARSPRATAVFGFKNEPLADFTRSEARESIRAALTARRSMLGRKCPLVIGNKPVSTRDWSPSLNPANQLEVIGYAARATRADADAAIEACLAARSHWARTSVADRTAILQRLGALLRRDKAALTALEILEAGKNWTEADADVAEAIDFCEYYAREMLQLGTPRVTQRVPGETNLQHWLPRGVAVVISPWNFPLAILAGMTAAAVAAGNPVIMKPADPTPVIAAAFMDLWIEAGCPPGVVNLLSGPGSDIGAYLVEHPSVDVIAFTGSKEVGLRIWEAAGRTVAGQVNLKKVVCEMGGKNCLIVDDDADLDDAVGGVLLSAFGYQGQKCSALSRLIVLDQQHDRFVERLIAAAASLRVGPAEEPGTIIGPVITREAQKRILDMIEAGRSEAHLAWQGVVPSDPNACYVTPTIFTGVKPGSRLFREEIFGPVLAITRARDFDEAIALANQSEFALTGGCYSRSPANLERARNEMVCGNLYLNRPITGALVGRQPFGGFRMSGGGTKAGGPEYLLNFLLPRVITENCLRHGIVPSES